MVVQVKSDNDLLSLGNELAKFKREQIVDVPKADVAKLAESFEMDKAVQVVAKQQDDGKWTVMAFFDKR